jgi:long-chain acyl-CoA synthetase
MALRWAADRDEPAGAVVFTSGSTGTPRGVVLREQDLAAGIRAWSALWPAIPQRTVAFLPVSHVAQRIMGHYLMCLFGTTVHTTQPHLAADAIEQVKPDLLLGVPRTWSGLADALAERPAPRSGWASARCSPDRGMQAARAETRRPHGGQPRPSSWE